MSIRRGFSDDRYRVGQLDGVWLDPVAKRCHIPFGLTKEPVRAKQQTALCLRPKPKT